MTEAATVAVPPPTAGVHAALLELSRLAADSAERLSRSVDQAGELVGDCLVRGGRVLACGNGGSAADAQHFIAELVGHMSRERRALPAIALSSDPSIVTAIANDYGYEQLFARQVEAHGGRGDVLIALSTSGRSPNVLRALRTARQMGMGTIALVGQHVEPEVAACDVYLAVASSSTPRIQEIHMALLHAICERAEDVVMRADAGRESER